MENNNFFESFMEHGYRPAEPSNPLRLRLYTCGNCGGKSIYEGLCQDCFENRIQMLQEDFNSAVEEDGDGGNFKEFLRYVNESEEEDMEDFGDFGDRDYEEGEIENDYEKIGSDSSDDEDDIDDFYSDCEANELDDLDSGYDFLRDEGPVEDSGLFDDF